MRRKRGRGALPTRGTPFPDERKVAAKQEGPKVGLPDAWVLKGGHRETKRGTKEDILHVSFESFQITPTINAILLR